VQRGALAVVSSGQEIFVMYSSRRTVPIRDDQEFLSLAEKINDMLVLGDHQKRKHEGSASWLGLANTPRHKETIFKLCYYGEGDMAFGIRRDFLEKKGPKLHEIKWPLKFGVPPRTDVEFWGFAVRDDEPSLSRIDRVLQGLGILLDLGDDQPRDYRSRERQFDEGLDSLGL